MNAIFYLLHTGCQWRNLQQEFPPGKPSMATSANSTTMASWNRSITGLLFDSRNPNSGFFLI
jgi:transposase